MTDQEYYKVSEVAKRFHVSPYTVREWLNTGNLKGGKINGHNWRIPRSEVERLARELYGEPRR